MKWLLALAAIGLQSAAPAKAAEPKPTGSPAAPGYQPIGKDEQGLWATADEDERALKTSKMVLRDPALNGYLRSVLCRTVGHDSCGAARLYIVRTPLFNAYAMANGVIVVQTGALLRIQDEAELAAILGHEFTHFEHRHQLAGLKSARNAMSWAVWLTMASFIGSRPYNYQPVFASSHFSFARDQERDADVTGLAYMQTGGFRPQSASMIWAQMRTEEDKRAAALGVSSLKDAWRGPFSTHPMNVERMLYLRKFADEMKDPPSYVGVNEYRAALASFWPMLIDDQVKLNDFGGSEYLLGNLASDGWTGPLLYARAELYRARGGPADLLYAVNYYEQACVLPDAPPESWRGLGLTKARLGERNAALAAIKEYLQRRPDAKDRAVLESMGDTQ
ncbi:MAG: M48 family metallopeptidase [Sphingomonas sp.]